jgi:hypothetical protein
MSLGVSFSRQSTAFTGQPVMSVQELAEYERECLRSQRSIAEPIASSGVDPVETERNDGDPPGAAGAV